MIIVCKIAPNIPHENVMVVLQCVCVCLKILNSRRYMMSRCPPADIDTFYFVVPQNGTTIALLGFIYL